MRTLSIITLCFIIAASAYAGEKRDRRDSKDRPAAAQSSARDHSSARVSAAWSTPRTTPPAGPVHGVDQPRSYQPGSIGYAPRTHETTNSATAIGYRPGSSTDSPSHQNAGSPKTSPYFLHSEDQRPGQVAQAPDTRPNPPSPGLGPVGYEPLRARGDSHPRDRGHGNSDRSSSGYSGHQNSQPHASYSSSRDHASYQPDRGPSHGGAKVYSTGYSPHGTTYTVGYHRPTKIVVPRTYVAPSFRLGRYYYPAVYRYPKPCYFGFWAVDYDPGFSYRSVYFNFGILPYVQITRIRECTFVSVAYVSDPLYISGRMYFNNNRFPGLDDALGDIRSAWISGRFDLIERHVRDDSSLSVLTDGKYDYAISSKDYLDMTHDAISDLNTVSFVWDKVRERKDGTITAFGEHSYRSSEGARNVYVSYTFQRVGSHYYLTEVGSSLSRLD